MAPLKVLHLPPLQQAGAEYPLLRGHGSIEGRTVQGVGSGAGQGYPWLRGHGSTETLWSIFNDADTRRRTRARGLNI